MSVGLFDDLAPPPPQERQRKPAGLFDDLAPPPPPPSLTTTPTPSPTSTPTPTSPPTPSPAPTPPPTPSSKPADTWEGLARKEFGNIPSDLRSSVGALARAAGETTPADLIKEPLRLIGGAAAGDTFDMLGGKSIPGMNTELSPRLAQWGTKLRADAEQHLAQNAPQFGGDWAKEAAYGITDSLVKTAPFIVAGAVTRNPYIAAAGLGTIGTDAYADRYATARDNGRSPTQASMDAAVTAFAQTVPMMLPLGVLMRPGQRFLGKALSAGGAWAAQTAMTELIQSGYDKGVLNDQTPWSDVLKRIGYDAATQSVTGMVAGTAEHAMEFGRDAYANWRATQVQDRAIKAMKRQQQAATDMPATTALDAYATASDVLAKAEKVAKEAITGQPQPEAPPAPAPTPSPTPPPPPPLHEAVEEHPPGPLVPTTPGALATEHEAEVSRLEAEGTHAAAEQHEPKERETDYKPIGENKDGKTIYEDPRGVRSILEDGVRITEPVHMRPTERGIEFATDRATHPEFEPHVPGIFDDIVPPEPEPAPRGEPTAEDHNPPEPPREVQTEPEPPRAPEVHVTPEEGEPEDRRKPIDRQRDVGEVMEGKRSAVNNTLNKTEGERGFEKMLDLTRDATDFRSVLAEDATSGAHNYVNDLRKMFHSFLEHEGGQQGGGRSRWATSFRERLKDVWDDRPDELKASAADYIATMQTLRDHIAGAHTVADVHRALKDVVGDEASPLSKELRDYEDHSIWNWRKSMDLDAETPRYHRDTDKLPDRATPLVRPSTPVENIERHGLPDWRKGEDIVSQKFRDHFNFRGVEFGEWVTGKEGLAHVNAAYDALNDFAHTLGIKPTDISLGGKLGLAFGSRGKGRHSAHFEPHNNVINLTKTKGDGSVAHEWGHALDHALSRTPEGKKVVQDIVRTLKQTWSLPGALKQLDSILRGDTYIVGKKNLGPLGTAQRYVDSLWRGEGWGAVSRTSYKDEADALGKDYWGNDAELFARAFESWVFDKLAAEAHVSPYLVNNWVADGVVSKEAGYRGKPYPSQVERERFNQSFQSLFDALGWDENGMPYVEHPDKLVSVTRDRDAIGDALKAIDLQSRWSELRHENTTRRTPVVPEPDRTAPTPEQTGEFAGLGHGDEGTRTQTGGAGRGPGELGTGSAGEGVNGQGAASEAQSGENGAGDGGVGGAARTPAVGPEGSKTDRAERGLRGLNYRIPEDQAFDKRTVTGRIWDNMAAITALKRIEAGDGSVSLADQKVLAKYVGWGGIPQIFDEKNAKFAQQRADLKTALTSAEYAAARASTINAHYTSPDVVRGMWQAMRDLGYPGGVTLEPGMGVGNFLGMAPEDLPNKFTGVEMDHITGRIARALYPEARVLIKPFEETPIPRGVFDGVIGNVPFANVKPNDKEYNPGRALSLHNYFIHKAAHLMKPGGVMGLVTTHYTLDAVNTKERQLLHKAGLDLLGAVRLPDTAFKANAGTEVTTDILFFRKRMPGEEPGNDRWLKTENVDLDGKPTPINAYFLDHPQAVLGEHSSRGTMYAKDSYTVAGSAENLRQRIEDAVRNIIKPEAEAAGRLFAADPNNTVEGAIDDIALPPAEVKDNAYYLKDGVIKQRIGPAETTPTMPASHQPIIKSFIGLRDAAREVLARQREEWDGQGKAPWADAQKKLNSLYDAFVKAHGPINKVQITRRTDADGEVQEYRRYPNLAKFKDDPDVFLVSALERADEEKDTFTKSALMSERVLEPTKEITHVETPQEALIASMNMRGGVDLPYMAKILGAESPEDVSKNLAGRIFKDPQTGQWHIAEKYLSGNVRAKLALAEQFAKSDAAYKANIDALKAVQPPDLKPSEINVRLGVGWIPPQDYADFAAFLLKSPANIAHIPSEAMWRVELADPYSVANRNEWGVHGASFSRLFEDALNQRSTTVTFRDDEGKTHTDVQKTVVAQEKQRAIQDEFERWVWADADRAKRLSDKYNWEVNNLAIPTYNGDHLTLPGSSSTIELRSTQKKAVWRYLVSGNTLLDHVVGAGKTFTSIAAGMEAKRLGLLKKPTYVVPNHMLEQFSREFMQLYPGAHLIVADKDNFAGDVRRRFVARVAAENWDAIIMPHSGFEKVPMSPEYQVRFLQREVQEYEGLIRSSKGDDVTVKELEKAKARRLAKIKDLMQAKDKDKGISFEEMGSDGVFLDEAHLFKNLEFATKSRGMQAASSQRAFDMFMKARYIDEMSPGRGLMFMTGTPISNSMAEMYTMQRYLGHPALADRGLTHFDAWAAAFGDMVTQAEITPDGASARLKTRFARFRNIPELVALYRQFADLVTTQDLLNTGQIKLPKMIGDKVQTHEIEGSDALKGYVSELAQRAEQVRNREVKPEEDNMLKISGDGRKAALDLRLVDPTSEAEPDRKAIAVADRVSDIWKKTKARKGTQLVFLDLSTPNSEGRFNVYDDIRAALLKRGIPRDEIAFVHDADNDQKKAKLFESVREGRVRVLFGSTDKMGVGTNVQKRLYALHHVDAPWRPADLEQREGRIIRQGNENPEVEVHRYITTGSFDAYMWQTLERKARFINQVKNGDPNVRNAEDIDEQALSYAEVKALASGNPLILDKARADADVDRLSRLRRAHSDNQRTMQWEVKGMPERNQADENVAAGYEKDAKAVKFQAEDKYEATIGKKKFNKRADAMNALAKAITDAHIAAQKEPSENGHEYPGGEYAGIKFNIHTDGKHDPTLLAELPSKVRGVEVNLSAANGALARLENYLRKLPELANEARERVAARRDREKDLRAQLNRKFEKEEQYQAAIKRQKEIDEKLGLTEKAQPESAVADTDEEGNVTGKGNIHGMADLFNRWPERPMAVADVRRVVSDAIRGWKAAPKINIVQSMADLPQHVQDWADGAEYHGIYDDGEGVVHIIADGQGNPEQVRGTLFHEALAHAGLTRLYRGRVGEIMDALYASNPNMRRQADELNDALVKAAGSRAPNRVAVEEVLAHQSEAGIVRLPFWDTLKSVVRDFGRRLGLNLRYTDNDIRAILGRAHEAGMNANRSIVRPQSEAPLGSRKKATPAVPPQPPQRGAGPITRLMGDHLEKLTRGATDVTHRLLGETGNHVLEDLKIAVTPMAAGTARARAPAKDFANTLRAVEDQWDRVDNWLKQNVPEQSRGQIYDAMNAQGEYEQKKAAALASGTEFTEPEPADGIASLSPEQRDVAEELNRRATNAMNRAIKLGMTNADPIPWYVPRMLVNMTSEGAERVGKQGTSGKEATNLSTTTAQLKHRKYLHLTETEEAARKKFGEDVEVVRDIRTLALATRRLERAIAGRILVDNVKRIGADANAQLVAEGEDPGPHFFTMDHPAFRTFKPDFVKQPDPDRPEGYRMVPARDQTGAIKGKTVPIYIHREFEGPLKAVFNTLGNRLVQAAMTLKGKSMSVIMFSPLMHNAVIWGKAFPAAPLRLLTPVAYRGADGQYHYGIKLYVDGHQFRQSDENRQRMLNAGVQFLGKHYAAARDVTAIAEEPTIAPGRSWTAKAAGLIPRLWDPSGQTSDRWKKTVDDFGDFWHGEMLWERIGDLQAGLFQQISDSEQRRGLDPQSADRLAADFANQYAGALPMESLSRGARNFANLALFSRSFTLSNLKAWKTLVTGLPLDVQAQIMRDKGVQTLNRVQGVARRKALSLIAMDVAMAHVGLILGAYAISAFKKYVDGQANAQPDFNWNNEPGRENRVLVGYDRQGTGIYARLPTGKVGEDLIDWATEPRETLLKKLSPYSRVLYSVAANDSGFGRKLFDETDDTPQGWADAMAAIAGQVVNSLMPISQFKEGADLIRQGATGTGLASEVAPWAGVTLSKGYPGGPQAGYYHTIQAKHQLEVQRQLPGIFEKLRSGDTQGATADMVKLGFSRGLMRAYYRMAMNPGVSKAQIRGLARWATPEQMATFQKFGETAQ